MNNTRMRPSIPGMLATALLMILFMLFPLTTQADESHTEFVNNMKAAHAIGTEVGVDPATMQAILLKETNGGRSQRIGNRESPVGKRSYGLMQVQVVAARSILQRFPHVLAQYFPNRSYKSLFEEEIIALLLADDEANMRIASYHFKLYLKLSNYNWDKAVASYVMGIGNASKISNHSDVAYVQDIKRKINSVVKPFNNKHGL